MFASEYISVKTNLFQANTLPAKTAENPSIVVRIAQPNDMAMIDAMHDRLSKDSLYYRYLVSTKPTLENMQRLYSYEEEDSLTLVAILEEPQERIVGIACYKVEPDQESSAEPAVLVEDNYQGRGVGKQLLSALYQQGIKMGIKSFISYVHPANHKMLQLIKNCGLPSQNKYSDGLTKIQISLNPASAI